MCKSFSGISEVFSTFYHCTKKQIFIFERKSKKSLPLLQEPCFLFAGTFEGAFAGALWYVLLAATVEGPGRDGGGGEGEGRRKVDSRSGSRS